MPKSSSVPRKRKPVRSTKPARPPEDAAPIPSKSKPGDRARQPLSKEEARQFVEDVAKEAARLKKETPVGQKADAFLPLQESSGLARETLLRWAKLYKHLGRSLAKHLEEHGKTKMYFVSYHENPRELLDEGLPDAKDSSSRIDIRDLSAEELRRRIRDQHPGKRGSWFRRHGKRSLSNSLQNTIKWLREDVGRIIRLVDIETEETLSKREHTALLRFVSQFEEMLSTVTSAIKTKVSQDKKQMKKLRK